MNVRSLVAFLSLAGTLAACGGSSQPQPPQDTGRVDVSVGSRAVIDPTLVPLAVHVHVYGRTAKGDSFDRWYRASPQGSAWQIAIAQLPVGSYRLHGVGFLAGTLLPGVDPADYETPQPDAAFVVTSKGTVRATLLLQQTGAPSTVNNSAPTIDSVIASAMSVDSTAGAQDVVGLAATASHVDPNAQAGLAYRWSSSAAGTFSSATALTTTWTPDPGFSGTADITFQATDWQGASAAVTLKLDVKPGNGRGTITVGADVNTWPCIDAITADNAQILPGGGATVSALAHDPDSDAIAYAWADACVDLAGAAVPSSGVFGAPAAARTSYAPPAGAAACTLSLTVSDGRGGTNVGTLVVNVRAAPTTYSPEFVTAMMSPSTPAPGDSISFFVDAAEWNGSAYVAAPSYTWTSNTAGGLFSPVALDGSSIIYTPPACVAPGPVSYLVTVRAAGSRPGFNDSTLDFPFTINGP